MSPRRDRSAQAASATAKRSERTAKRGERTAERGVRAPERGLRLQKFLAHAGIGSRRKAEDLIREGRVTINGAVAELGQRVSEGDAVKLDGRRIHGSVEKHYFLLNKPRGTVTTLSDPQGRPTVIDLVPGALRSGLFPIGRLDYDTEGLLLLTNDGELAQRVSHPRHGCIKVYEAKVRGVPLPEAIQSLESGIFLAGRRTAPCKIRRLPSAARKGQPLASSRWRVELGEGRSRQIREMFQRLGHPVQKLRRTAIDGVQDSKLGIGKLRPLRDEELESLRRSGSASRRRTLRRPRRLAPRDADR